MNDDTKLLKIKYDDGTILTLAYGQDYSSNGGGGFFVTQNTVTNNLSIGKKFKRGDVLIYNKDFFTPDPYSTQVDLNLGYFTNVALLETGITMEDSSFISRETADALLTEPVQVRSITIKKSTIVHQIALIGTELKSINPLIVFDDSEIPDEFDDPSIIDQVTKLNRSTPSAKYNGRIVRIEFFHRCPIEQLSQSLQKIAKYVYKQDNLKSEFAKDSHNSDDFMESGPMTGDRIGSETLDEDTVIVKFYIQQRQETEAGNKIVFGGSLKSVLAEVIPENMPTGAKLGDSDVVVGAVLGGSSVLNRIVLSAHINGSVNRILEKAEKDLLDIFFSDK
jgi:hypothetical protein